MIIRSFIILQYATTTTKNGFIPRTINNCELTKLFMKREGKQTKIGTTVMLIIKDWSVGGNLIWTKD